MKNLIIYLGGDNQTGKINRPKLRRFLMKHTPGFTLHATGHGWWKDPASGRWHNESMVKIEITHPEDFDYIRLIVKIKTAFNQKEIGFRQESPIIFVD